MDFEIGQLVERGLLYRLGETKRAKPLRFCREYSLIHARVKKHIIKQCIRINSELPNHLGTLITATVLVELIKQSDFCLMLELLPLQK